ncbi:hypothetical protein BCR44DRAFT_1432915 [Catenaria anguillulae PL171]|uniref:Uncharacterized protein n=1 Tax=Catenaria anguillulae PL171 TaxID=765915 RepID=A0A1Y2HR46_9FUNG|nr:hypothetical protein BCR44DRAFT_1432915 [Catenaria anguillulae PL171]
MLIALASLTHMSHCTTVRPRGMQLHSNTRTGPSAAVERPAFHAIAILKEFEIANTPSNMDPDLDPTYPHPHHCHLVNPMANPFHSPLVLIPPLFAVDPNNPMQRTSVDHPTGPITQPQAANTESTSTTTSRAAMESAQPHDSQTQMRLDARDQDARMATLAQEQIELDRQEQLRKNNKDQEEQQAPAYMFIRDVSMAWGDAGSGEAQRRAAQAKAAAGQNNE